jgi:HNH endonuclease
MRLTFCAACGSPEDLQHHRLIPRAEGGSDEERNLITLCFGCHLKLHERQRNGRYRTSEQPNAGLRAAARRGTATLIEKARQRDANVLPVIRELEARGPLTLPELAEALNARGVKTARGARWHAASVARLFARNGLPTRSRERKSVS